MIDPIIKVVSGRDVKLTNFGSWAIRLEIMKQSPGADLEFGRVPMAVKETGIRQPAGHRFHVPIKHIAGAVSLGEVKGQDKLIGFGAQFLDGFQSRTRDGVLRPGQQVSGQLSEILGISRVVDIPDPLLNIRPD
jgi:hypothetical protein